MPNLIYFAVLIVITIIFFIIDAISHQKFSKKLNLLFHILGGISMIILILFFLFIEFRFTFLIYFSLIFFIIGFILIYLSFKEIKNNFLTAEKLTSSSIYTKIRHPMYLGVIILLIGISFLTSSMLVSIYSFIVILLFIWLSNYEEKHLLKKFGDKYKKYKEEVPMFIPKLVGKYIRKPEVV